MKPFDVAIVGGGIVGLATAHALRERFPDAAVVILEKEAAVGAHQTSHNSGVIHSGIYYRPGSLKARLCVAGARLLVEFCQAHGIPYRISGKVIVATDLAEIATLEALCERARANGVPGVSLVGPERLRELEPYAGGIKALHVPSAGVVDFGRVAQALAESLRARGVALRTAAPVRQIRRADGLWWLQTPTEDLAANVLITCGGLHADRLAAMAGAKVPVRILPFRGEYCELAPSASHLVRSMIYPVPRPGLPFLGVHLTRTISDAVQAGPNAVLALRREGYRRWDASLRDLASLSGYPGFWRMAARNWRTGVHEVLRSTFRHAFVRAAQRLVPAIRASDLRAGGCGVRAQAVDQAGRLLDDFAIVQHERAIHILNVPSPAATASLAIGRTIVEMAEPMIAMPVAV